MSMVNNKDPLLSAILVVPGSLHVFSHTMDCLRAQTIVGSVELVIVTPSRDQLELDESKLRCFHSWKVVEVGRVKSLGSGNAAGVFQASAPIIALTEDHSYVQKDWAELFVNKHRDGWAVVGPSMRNGNPQDLIGWADFLQAYVEWMEPTSSRAIRHLPGHNSSYKRDILLNFGSELETLMEAETVLNSRLNKLGYQLYLEAGICTTHMNFDSWSAFIPCRYHTGRQYAGTLSHEWHWYRRAVFAISSPAIPLFRLWNILKSGRKKKSISFIARVFPDLFLGLLLEGVGCFMGFLFGYGDSVVQAAKYEFDRAGFLKKDSQ
jgi:hypothetical protein